MREVWELTLASLRDSYPTEVFEPWFGRLEYVEKDDPNELVLCAPSFIHLKQLKSQ